MPKVTSLPTITSGTTATTFLVVDNRTTKRIPYANVLNSISADISNSVLVGPTGPTGPSGGPIPVGGVNGQVLVKTSSVNYEVLWKDLPSSIPVGGTIGQVLVKSSAVDYATEWALPNLSLPIGGTQGQVLLKASSNNYDATWGSADPGIPVGGDTGQVLTKSSTGNYATIWNTPTPGLPTGGGPGQILSKTSNVNYSVEWIDPPESGQSVTPTRNSFDIVTPTLANAAIENISFPAFENYVVMKIETSDPAWVRVYSDVTSRAADASRVQGADPVAGIGVIAEVITETGFLSQAITPGLIGLNLDSPVTNNVHLAIKNNSGASRPITVTITLIKLPDFTQTIVPGRASISATTAQVNADATANISLAGYKTYVLSNVQTSAPAWVRIYTNASSRAADASRNPDNDPIPGSGIIAEVTTTPSKLSQPITPGIIGFNTDSPVGNTVYIAVTNRSDITQEITVTLLLSALEV